jgi:hypothetical protein
MGKRVIHQTTGEVHQFGSAESSQLQSGCFFDEKHVDIQSYDHRLKRMKREDELVVKGDIEWGRDIKTLLKYVSFRTGLYKLLV